MVSLGPLVVILIIILEVILAPLPGGIIPIITGFFIWSLAGVNLLLGGRCDRINCSLLVS